MAKFYGAIGYANDIETVIGIHTPEITEVIYCGDVIKNNKRSQTTDNVNDDITTNNVISIIADPFATKNFHSIVYAVFMGIKWKVTVAEVQYPRVLLTLGGVYNER